MENPENDNIGQDGLDGEIQWVGVQPIYSEDDDDYAWQMAVFRWAIPSWAIEDYEKLDLLLHIDFEDNAGSGNSGDRFDFDGLYDNCYDKQFNSVTSGGYDSDCQGPEWEIKNVPVWERSSEI